MFPSHSIRHKACRPAARGQRGVIMIFTLMVLVLLLMSSMALFRSFDSSLFMAGNIGFKRDLTNQAERGMKAAIALFPSASNPTASLAAASTRESNLLSQNYYASAQATDSHGIPSILIKDSTFTGTAAKDISDTTSGVTIRYVIDRLCDSSGPFSANTCVTLYNPATAGGSHFLVNIKVGQDYRPVYRISVRVKGPRNTQAYLQSVFSF